MLFLLIWPTGFIAARAQTPFGEPLGFLTLRFAAVIAIFLCLALAARKSMRIGWPAFGHNLVAGALLQGIYLGSVFYAIDLGMPAGVAALVQSLAPVLTAILAGPLLGEAVSRRQWLGLLVALLGVTLVLWPKLGTTGFTAVTILVSLVGVLGLVFGGLYQRLYVAEVDMRVANAVQYLGALIVVGTGAVLLEPLRLVTHPVYWAALVWAVLALSVGAATLYIHFLRRGAVTKASALMFLVPAIAALMAWALFGETLTSLQLVGGAVALGGVVLAQGK